MKHYIFAKEFTDAPGGRDIQSGKYSGEEFRESHLVPLLADNEQVTIDLQGCAGYACCFLEEAFGGLVRHKHYTLNQLKNKLFFLCNEEPEIIDEIWSYIVDAQDCTGK